MPVTKQHARDWRGRWSRVWGDQYQSSVMLGRRLRGVLRSHLCTYIPVLRKGASRVGLQICPESYDIGRIEISLPVSVLLVKGTPWLSTRNDILPRQRLRQVDLVGRENTHFGDNGSRP